MQVFYRCETCGYLRPFIHKKGEPPVECGRVIWNDAEMMIDVCHGRLQPLYTEGRVRIVFIPEGADAHL